MKEFLKIETFNKVNIIYISNVINNINIIIIFIIIKMNVINEINIKNIIIVINKTIMNVIINLLKISFNSIYLMFIFKSTINKFYIVFLFINNIITIIEIDFLYDI